MMIILILNQKADQKNDSLLVWVGKSNIIKTQYVQMLPKNLYGFKDDFYFKLKIV